MNQALINSVSQANLKATPQVKVGQTVKVHQKIKEGEKTRTQVFSGLVIKMRGEKGINQTFTVRNIVSGVGVEKIFPVHSDNIEKIEIIKQNKVRRAKLYYMRERTGKSARLKAVSSDTEALNKLIDKDSIYTDLPETVVASQEEANTTQATQEETTVVEDNKVENTEKAEEVKETTTENTAETPKEEKAEKEEKSEAKPATETKEEVAEEKKEEKSE